MTGACSRFATDQHIASHVHPGSHCGCTENTLPFQTRYAQRLDGQPLVANDDKYGFSRLPIFLAVLHRLLSFMISPCCAALRPCIERELLGYCTRGEPASRTSEPRYHHRSRPWVQSIFFLVPRCCCSPSRCSLIFVTGFYDVRVFWPCGNTPQSIGRRLVAVVVLSVVALERFHLAVFHRIGKCEAMRMSLAPGIPEEGRHKLLVARPSNMLKKGLQSMYATRVASLPAAPPCLPPSRLECRTRWRW